ncbi:phosphoribosylglycinamide formyltransferase [Desulfovibrio sp. OttesenSCG-928-M14]|nr:phosphoribosylglycinamide formyltransferase [Desulfovibrio sp. OttesenSCG-928-M14]
MTLQIAALASGTGSNVAAIIKCIEDGRLDAQVRLVLSNKSDAPVLRIAQDAGIAVWARDHKDYPDRESFDRDLLAAIKASGADTVVLAGYMRLLTPLFVRSFPGRILNVHPAILPSFPGVHGAADALEYGVRLTGPTVHFVDEGVDSGPVIIQAVVPVVATDTRDSLMPRIHALEHRIYPQALQWLAEERLKLEGRRVHLLPGKKPHAILASGGRGPLGPWMACPALEDF